MRQRIKRFDDIQAARERKVYKADVLVNARYNLSVPEQRLILYAITLIKKDDTADKFYTIDLNKYCDICGFAGESYTKAKRLLIGLRDKSWFAKINPDIPEEETSISWFSKVKITRGSTVQLKFDEDIFPFVKDLMERYRETGQGYTSYVLQSVLPMKCKYSIRLYEILKAKIKNGSRLEWFYELEELKEILECTSYKRYPDFRRKVLEPAIDEINRYSDLFVDYDPAEKRNINKLYFVIVAKNKSELLQAHHDTLTVLDGNIHFWDIKGGDNV